MCEDDPRIIESVVGDVMNQLGYERLHVKPGEEIQFDEATLKQFRQKNDKLLQEATSRQQQASVIEEIRSMAS